MFRVKHLLMNQNNGGESSSGYGTTESAAPTTTPQASGDTTNPPAAANSQVQGTQDATTANQQQSQQTQNTQSQAATPPVDNTGYGSTPPPPAATTQTQTETPPADDKPLELDLKGMKDDESEIKTIREIAKEQKLTKDQAQALVNAIAAGKTQTVEAQKQIEIQKQTVYKTWETELRNDPNFGGANFDHNIHNVNRVLNENMPGLKNILTGGGKRLPPSIMRDLKGIAERLYGERTHVDGGAGTQGAKHSPLDFYNKK